MMAISTTPIGILVKRYRLARGWTQDELSHQAGIGMRTISDIERGLSRYPHRDTVQQLIAIFTLQGEAALEFQRASRVRREVAPITRELPYFPQAMTPFTGREADIATAYRTFTHLQARLLTLVGPAGVGKTRLAIEIARTLIEEAPWHFVDLTQAMTSDDVVRELIRQLDISEQPQQVPLKLLNDWLCQQQVSLVLDNFEQAIGAASLIERLLIDHLQLRICVTSRIPLKTPAEIVQEVIPFPIPDHRRLSPQALNDEPTVRLFTAVAQSVMPSFVLTPSNSALIVRICARLDGLPLGIELVATQVSHYTLTEILRQIAHFAGMIIFTPLVRGQVTRQQSLSNAIAWSYERLDAPIRMLFRRLCIFAGEFEIDAVIGICEGQAILGIDVIDGLAILLDHHLVGSVVLPVDSLPARFSILGVIREYGLDQLAKHDELAMIRLAHARYFAATLRRHEADFVGEQQAERLMLYSRDYDNIVAALRTAHDTREIHVALDLVSSLWWYWEKRRTLTEGREWIAQMLALSEDVSYPIDPAMLGRAYYGAAVLANAQGDLAQAEHDGQACLQWCLATGDLGHIAQAHTLLGTIANMSGEKESAAREYEAALSVLRQVASPRLLVPVLNNFSALAIEQGDFIRAKALLDESLIIKHALGDQRGIAVGLINRSEWHKQQGDLSGAEIDIAEAEGIFFKLGDQVGMAMAANNAGEIALARQEGLVALAALQRSLALFQQSENHTGIAMVQRNLGDVYLLLDDLPAAAQSWQMSLFEQPMGPHSGHCRMELAVLSA